jgi:hypothetical protein
MAEVAGFTVSMRSTELVSAFSCAGAHAITASSTARAKKVRSSEPVI